MKNGVIIAIVVVLVLAAAWYFGMGGRHYFEMGSQMHMNSQMSSGTSGNEMVECPVMWSRMKKAEASCSMEYKGKTYYFCCPGCADAFKNNPERFIKERG